MRAAVMHPGATVVGTVDPVAAAHEGVPNYQNLDVALDAVQGLEAAIVATPTIDHVDSTDRSCRRPGDWESRLLAENA